MCTRKLYYEDCHLDRFTARVTGCEKAEQGFWITLDSTAFYPEGGGQAGDTGTLDTVRVLDTQPRQGSIVHLCDDALTPGSQVTGIIDLSRRFDLMQQHTGEHILSGVLFKRYGCHNVGFHMGREFVEVDFDKPIPQEDLESIEWEVNQALWQDLPVECWYPEPEELGTLSYRSKRELSWPVRIVRIPGFDSCACCGVHVARTGEVGLMKIVSCVKFHQGVRMEILCGSRAFRYLQAVWEQNRQVSQAFSAKTLETGAAAVKMNETLAAEKYRASGLQMQVTEVIARSYVNQEDVLYLSDTAMEPENIRALADQISQVCHGFAAVFAPREDGSYSYSLASRDTDLTELGTRLNASLNGRGGGKPRFRQGSVRADRQRIEAFFAQTQKQQE